MNCIIVEDQVPAQRILQKFIGDYGKLELVNTFSDPVEALQFLQEVTVDLIFLDIHLPKLSGMEFLKALQQNASIILTTAYPDYALASYDFNVVDYLLKPFSFDRFLKAVLKVNKREEATLNEVAQPTEIFIKSGYEYIKVDISDIVYIHADMDYTEIYTIDRKLLSSDSLKQWQEKLNPKDFVRIHKSYLINFSQLEKIVGNQCYMKNEATVSIGRAYKDELMKRLK